MCAHASVFEAQKCITNLARSYEACSFKEAKRGKHPEGTVYIFKFDGIALLPSQTADDACMSSHFMHEHIILILF